MFFWSLFSWDQWLCLGENIERRYSNECNRSYYGSIFITWKYNAMNKSWMWPQNWLRQTCNFFVFTFIKHLLKRRDVLHIKCLVQKVINHIVLIWTIRFNVKQVKQKPLKVCSTWKVIELLEFYVFPNISMLLVILFTINTYLVVHSFVFSKNVFHWELLKIVLSYT